MSNTLTTTPVVMSINHLDPSGGAGIAADIETLSSLGCHCTPIITRLSACDTYSEIDSQTTDTSLLIEQIRAILEDIPVDLIKIGDIASIANAEAIHTILNDYPDIPVVLSPRFSSKNNDNGLCHAIRHLLLPTSSIAVISERKAYQLAPGADNLATCAQELFEYGCDSIFISGAQDTGSEVCNQLFSRRGLCQQYHWERLPYDFLGASSTLSAAMSAYLAHKLSLAESVQQAQKFTWDAMRNGRRIGMGQLLLDRMHWCRK